jgi:hypothetical protein
VTAIRRRAKFLSAMIRHALFFVLFIGLGPLSWEALARDDDALCEGTAIVTGTRQETRAEGLAHALRDVLVKRSGDPALLHDPRVDPLEAKAADMVEDYLYLDRMSGEPKHDEQGTRDRPYTLIARFAPAKIDAALAELGDRPWLARRPKLLVRIMITDSKRASFPLTADGDNDERQRQALLAAASRFGMHVVLEPMGKAAADTPPDTLVITGTLRWSDTDPGWAGTWRIGGDQATTWGIKGVSFDDAFRDLVWGAMAVASGHERPR